MTCRRILVLTAGFGEGHNSAARHLAVALNSRAGVEATVHDPLSVLGARYEAAKRRHVAFVEAAPALWKLVYHAVDRLPLERVSLAALGAVRRELSRLLDESAADTVVSTHPLYPFLLEPLRAERPVRSALMITDSITVNRIWSRAPVELRLCADRYSARVLHRSRASGVIHATGFPVSDVFTAPSARRDPGRGEPLRILLLSGSVPRDTVAIAVAVARLPGVALTVATGRHDELGRRVRAAVSEAGCDCEVLGWVSDMPERLRAHHVVLGKAGGATTHETFAARTPLIITQVLPGQEEGNARLVERLGVGEVALTPDDVVRAVGRLMRCDFSLWLLRRSRLERLTRADGAARAADVILSRK